MTSSDLEFQFGGRLSLDLTWSLRYRSVAPTDLLATPVDLGRWITSAVAPVTGPLTASDLTSAVELREAVYAGATSRIAGTAVGRDVRSTVNDWAARPGPFRSLGGRTGASLHLRPGAEVESALAAVALDAVDLLSLDDGRLRLCEGPGCSLVFYDSSRPGTRRWCSTERCGNRVNTTTYRRRRAGGRPTT
jgi:predicted RNA-binding Zn ribbon-like protein